MAGPLFTIGTLLTNREQYAAMRASMEAHGFGDDCEYIVIDNTKPPQTDAYAGLNQILNRASGDFVILCHQDLLLLRDGRKELEDRLSELTALDPHWALAGNAGARRFRQQHMRITDIGGDRVQGGPFPARVYSLDENFIIVRRESRVGFSRDLSGFHMYGTDICMMADILGWTSYVIDFHLEHLGEGRMGQPFWDSRDAFITKWRRALRHREMQTTATYMYLTGAEYPLWLAYLKSKWLRKYAKRLKGRTRETIVTASPD